MLFPQHIQPEPYPHLDLETPAATTTTGTLEFPSLGLDVRLLVLVGTKTEVPDGFPSVLGATKQEGVATSGAPESKLIQGNSLATSSLNPGTGSCGESQGSDRHLWDGQETIVIGHGTNNDNSPLGILGSILVDDGVRCVTGDLAQGHRGTVDLGHEQAAEHRLVESAVGTTG